MDLLSDPGRIIQKDLDIQEYTDPEHNPMIPHTLVLKPGLVIHKIYNGYWFWGRPSIADLWQDLRAVTSEIRPDWDRANLGSVKLGTPAISQISTGGINAPDCHRLHPGRRSRRRRLSPLWLITARVNHGTHYARAVCSLARKPRQIPTSDIRR